MPINRPISVADIYFDSRTHANVQFPDFVNIKVNRHHCVNYITMSFYYF